MLIISGNVISFWHHLIKIHCTPCTHTPIIFTSRASTKSESVQLYNAKQNSGAVEVTVSRSHGSVGIVVVVGEVHRDAEMTHHYAVQRCPKRLREFHIVQRLINQTKP